MKQLFLTLFFLLSLISMKANDFPLQAGEELSYDIHYKYGLVMLKAGTANFKIVESSYNNINSFQSTLDFKTASFFDKIFKMRDTLYSQMAKNLQPLYHIRSVHEGNYHYKEEIFFNRFGTDYSEANVKRRSGETLKFDTILFTRSKSYDVLNLILILCSLDYSPSEYQKTETLSLFMGREKITVTVRFEGQSIVEKSETLKYKTYKISLDFFDAAFNESKSAIEIWMSDDENRIPVKIKAKLRIGTAEANLTTWKNLKYPLSSEVKIPVK
ncbi:MAG: DUF3108 domain-containing protein [Candidatus Azobacteroides sp.]|nr:DUF3108 domain-containing protein [Candidatus Azobacteroides sp.]